MEELTKDLHRQLSDALNSAFPKYFDLEQMVYYSLDKPLPQIVAEGTPTSQCTFQLIRWAESTGNVTRLVEGAYAQNPTNPALRAFVDTFRKRSESARFGVPSTVDSIRGIAPRYSTLDHVLVAFGPPTQYVARTDSNREVRYPGIGLRIICTPRNDNNMVVDLIQIEAPCREKLSLSGAYIGMSMAALQHAFIGNYRSNLSRSGSPDIAYDPLEPDGCRLRILVAKDFVDAILMSSAA